MLRKRIEKLEAHFPVSPGKLLGRLDRQALNCLSGTDRGLVTQLLAGSNGAKIGQRNILRSRGPLSGQLRRLVIGDQRRGASPRDRARGKRSWPSSF
jgi:hypothetical protein